MSEKKIDNNYQLGFRKFANPNKQKFMELYYSDCWIQIVQFDDQNKSLQNVVCPNTTVLGTFVLFNLFGLCDFPENSNDIKYTKIYSEIMTNTCCVCNTRLY